MGSLDKTKVLRQRVADAREQGNNVTTSAAAEAYLVSLLRTRAEDRGEFQRKGRS